MDTAFAVRLRQLRIDKKMTQKELADRLHVSITVVSSYENGKGSPPLKSLQELAVIFNVHAEYLLGLENREWVSVNGLTENNIEKVENLISDFRNGNKK